jgi:alpha-amylase/alpha-mannosidase (GH57 family)
MAENQKLKVAILWHMHQPFYYNPEKKRFEMPWVRFHGLKDYLDMPLLATEQKGVKVTFNLVPSLLDQIEMYGRGVGDRHLELTRISARNLQPMEKREILENFFAAHYPRMIEPYPRYRQLFRKMDSCGSDLDLAIKIFSSSEWRDLQVWSNLVWIDPIFRSDPVIKPLFEKGRDFTESDKEILLSFEFDILARIVPTYQKLYREQKIDISFTPYYHPIIPLLIDTDSAREALPEITLPENRFCFPEDAAWQIKKSVEKFKTIFNDQLRGMWPSEGSVSEEALRLMLSEGIKWAASDQEVLYHSLLKSGLTPDQHSYHTVYQCDKAKGLSLFFRDRGLSDRIGFVYSTWEPERAVDDFIDKLKGIREYLSGNLENAVVPVILDGENAWEFFADDGLQFLRKFYQTLAEDPEIETIFFKDAADAIEPTGLSHLFAGSWINHNFSIWIGHSEDNAAWDLLYKTRKDLIEFEKYNRNFDRDKITKAWQKIYCAEGSDWCWWYGDDHPSDHKPEFDKLYRNHLKSVYSLLDLEPPPELAQPIYRAETETVLALPEALVTPSIDGRITHYYEWSGAGYYDCLRSGTAMHRSDFKMKTIYFAYDHECFYIRLDFDERFDFNAESEARIVLDFDGGVKYEIESGNNNRRSNADFSFSFSKIMEIKINRKALLQRGSGRLEFVVSLFSKDKLLERWPPDKQIIIDIPEKEDELFWHI